MYKLVICVALLALTSLPAKADSITQPSDFLSNKRAYEYVASQSMMQIFYQLGVAQDKKFGLQSDCKSRYDVLPLYPAVISPIDFPENKQNPTKGIWIMRYSLSRCSNTKIYNALFFANPEGNPPKYQSYFPGSTQASPLLVKDTMLAAITHASLRSGLNDCKNIDVLDMRVSDMTQNPAEGDKSPKGSWNESWTFSACGRQVEVPITFTPDANGGGTSFTVR